MYKIVFFIIVVLSFSSCTSEDEKLPEGILEEEQLVELLIEVELSQAFIKLNVAKLDSINQDVFYQNVFEEHQVSIEQFNASLEYYAIYPEVLEDIYVRVIDRLSERQAESKKIEESEEENFEE